MTVPLYPAAAVRALDREAIEGHGIAGITLMRRAGEAAFALLQANRPEARHCWAFCGGGNNGGDAYVVAELARQAGLDTRVVALKPVADLGGDAARAAQRYLETGGEVLAWEDGLAEEMAQAISQPADHVLVDGLLGTGTDRPLEGSYRKAAELMNALPVWVLALDVPSGICADRGRALGVAVRADATISFIGRKQGLYTHQGPDHAGRRDFDDLSVPAAVYDAVPVTTRCWRAADLAPLRRPRPRDSHKGDFGHVLIVGGDVGMSGAPRLAAAAALRCGAGLVTVATHPDHAALLNLQWPELMVRAIDKPADLDDLLQRVDVVAVGPGLGSGAWADGLMTRLVEVELPLVVDADGLNWLARHDGAPVRSVRVLTPHPGEAGRLLGCTTAEVQQDRFQAVRTLAECYQATVILKGCGSLVADGRRPERPVALCDAGNAAMASGGMGDALTGVVAALLAQGETAFDAAALGCLLHGVAGDEAARRLGGPGVLASDLIAMLPTVRNGAAGVPYRP